MNQTPQLDPVSVSVMVAAAMFAPEVAHIVGPYVIILAASTIGASLALARREKTSRMSAMWFFLQVNGLAVLLTATVAAIANSFYPIPDERTWFAPVALGLGFIGDRWPSVLTWCGTKISQLVDVLIKLKSGGGRD